MPEPILTLPPTREFFGYLSHGLERRNKRHLSTSAPIAEEIFSALEFYSEVDETGRKFLVANAGCSEAESKIIHPKFQAFVRQAKTFFMPAESLHHRARPLFYYYAFLNLAKAFLCVRAPKLFLGPEKFGHGILERHAGGKFIDECVEIKNEGVFVEMYKALTGQKLPAGTKFIVEDMLGYSTDIGFDFETKLGVPHIAQGKSRMCFDTDTKNKWPLIAIFGLTDLEKRATGAFNQFHHFFEEVAVDKQIGNEMFDIKPYSLKEWRFFQSKKIFLNNETGNREFVLEFDPISKKYFKSTVYNEQIDFHLSLPIGAAFEFPWNEFLAGYVIYFYLGSLVRYHPAYLESLLRTKEAWKLESFTKSASQTLLRQILGNILNEIYVFESR